jgi:hypothetical protein
MRAVCFLAISAGDGMSDLWVFGWTQLLTLVGFALTLILAVGGFNRWKREQIEGRRIETAIEALSLAYESKYVFGHIRSPMTSSYEYKDMPRQEHGNDRQWSQRGPFYAAVKRIELNKDFFERAFKLQPKCMAMFGRDAESIFMLMHEARPEIEVAAEMLAWQVGQYAGEPMEPQNADFYKQSRRDIWDHGGFEREKDKVGKKLNDFRERMEDMFRPVIGGAFKTSRWWRHRRPAREPFG